MYKNYSISYKEWEEKINPLIDNGTLDKEKIMFTYEEGDKLLQETHSIYNALENKATLMLTSLVTIFIALMGLFFAKYDYSLKFICQNNLVYYFLIIATSCFISILIIIMSLRLRSYQPIGNFPSMFLRFYSLDLINIVKKILFNIENDIKDNIQNNNNKAKLLLYSFYPMIIGILLSFICFLFLH